MKKLIILLMAMCLVASASAADIRYKASGPWQDVDADGTADHGWQTVMPGDLDTGRANWGDNTVTLDYATTVGKIQAGVDESGTFHILSGGNLTTIGGNNKIGNNGNCTGRMIIDAGGTFNSTGWLMIAGNSTVTGIATVAGTLNSASHLWMSTGSGSTSTLNINAGGVVDVGGMIGLGTVNAVSPSGGIATLNVNEGGLLVLSNIHSGIMNDPPTGNSIQPGSIIDISGSGMVTLPGDFVNVINKYAANGSFAGDGIVGAVDVVYDAIEDLTEITRADPLDRIPADGANVKWGVVDLSWTNLPSISYEDPNVAGADTYVDVWFGTDPNKTSPNYNKVVSKSAINATQVTTSTTVTATYYWQVDTYVYDNPVADDSLIEGFPISFNTTDDEPPTIVIDTPDTLTWVGEPVTLVATVTDDLVSATSVVWSVDPAVDPNITFSDESYTYPTATVTVTGDTHLPWTPVTATVSDALNPNADADVVTLDIAESPCQAAGGGFQHLWDVYVVDTNRDCIINLVDFAEVLAPYWLVDYSLQNPISMEIVIETDKDIYSYNETVVVSYENTQGNATDWIGLYVAGAEDTDFVNRRYLPEGSTEGSVSFVTPMLPVGSYDARLFFNDSFNVEATASFEVQ